MHDMGIFIAWEFCVSSRRRAINLRYAVLLHVMPFPLITQLNRAKSEMLLHAVVRYNMRINPVKKYSQYSSALVRNKEILIDFTPSWHATR